MAQGNGQSGVELLMTLLADVRALEKQMGVFGAKVDDMRATMTEQLGNLAAQSIAMQVAAGQVVKSVEGLADLYDDHDKRLGGHDEDIAELKKRVR